ncbi:MAG: hypothetical protein JWN26_386 [Candidatus Saccharibacteria bacterium]|nr:hypothetical protein [Candidatus Saccharibacteria bacterium]
MNKDVIYIDVEDDVTAIIGKIKASREKVIALVPPKRVGVLQSAVNLRLLDRMANSSNKHLVLITNNQALIALSAAAGIPVAKNLQSKPELAEITVLNVDDEEDIIDGSNLPIGELERTTDRPKANAVDNAIDELDIDNKKVDVASGMGAVAIKQPKKSKNGIKVPNFNAFRKRLFLGIAAFIVLVIFLIWANVYAPAATVIVTAKTIPSPVSGTVKLGGTAATNLTTGTLQTITQQAKQDMSVKFTATGSKTVGTAATGQVIFKNCETATSQTIPSGTIITDSAGNNYTTQATVVVSGGTGSFNGCTSPGSSTAIAVTANDIGTGYNDPSGTVFSVSGHSNNTNAYLRATASTDIAGGDSHKATVVTDSDITQAQQALSQLSTDTIKKQLVAKFNASDVVISDSFTVASAASVSTPAVGAEATGQATLTASTTFVVTAIAKSDLDLYLKDQLTKQLTNASNQRIYDDGVSKVVLAGYANDGSDPATVNLNTTGQVGPNIDATALKGQVKGKKSGEVQSLLSNISGVNDVTVNFSYPWVTTIPNDVNKIDVQFKLTNG